MLVMNLGHISSHRSNITDMFCTGDKLDGSVTNMDRFDQLVFSADRLTWYFAQ